jgi:branched-chain amino acid transport system substrate-binding protein
VQRRGAEVLLVEAVHLGQREFDGAVRRLQAAACDLVYFGLTEIESSFFTRALRAAGVAAHLVGADGGSQSPFPRLAGAAAEGVWETYAGQDAQAHAAGRTFLRAYREHYGECPIFGAEAYDAACVLLEALRRAAAPDRRALLAALHALDRFDGATGAIAFDPSGNRRDAHATLWRVVGGAMAPVG